MPFTLNRRILWQYDNPATVKKNLRDAVMKSTFRACDRAATLQEYRTLVAGNHGKIVALDIETGTWEMDINEISASMRLEARCPDAQIWFLENRRSLCSSVRFLMRSRSVKRTGRNPSEAVIVALLTGRNPWKVKRKLNALLDSCRGAIYSSPI